MRLRHLPTTTTALAIAALSACHPVPPPPLAAAKPTSLPRLEPYRIQIGDVLAIRLLLNPDLNEEVVVRPDGYISTAVVKDERAYGRTVPELTSALTHDYAAIISNPHLTVILQTFSPTRIFVGGEVVKPGESISVGLHPTLSQAIARAGGLRSDAGNMVFLIRRGPDDTPQISSAKLRDVVEEHDPKADIRLAQYDVVYVPHDGEAEVDRFLNQFLAPIIPVIWGFSYNVTPAQRR